MNQKLRFIDTSQSAFFATARARVDAYFKEESLSKHANAAMWGKVVFYLTGFIALYLLILLAPLGLAAKAGLAILLGVFNAGVGFNICHDALHGALSSNSRVNTFFGAFFNLLGANPYVWTISHNLVHHSYTNIPGHDDDLEIAPGLVRITEEDPLTKAHRYQHLYGMLLYGLASLAWVVRKDYVKFFQSKIGQRENNHPKIEYFNLFFFKALYYFLFIVLPLMVMDITWWQFTIGFLLMHFAEGFVLGLVFQLAHVVEGTSFPDPNEEGNIEEAWAVHQLQTTANFSPNSAFASFFCGGLNRQIEHHLFPKICHIHYPTVSKILKQTAHEFNLPYLENPTFFYALKSHYRLLRKFGKEAHEENNLNKKLAAYSQNEMTPA